MIADNLRVLMAKEKMNIQKTSEATGISRTTISNLVNGYSSGVQFVTIQKLAKALGCKPYELFQEVK